jgi:hypothetical protein
MSGTTTNRHGKRSKLFRRLNAGTHKLARRHQRHERTLLVRAQRVIVINRASPEVRT